MAKKALLVGINDYKQINDLSGCINDVTNARDVLLKYFGFAVPDKGNIGRGELLKRVRASLRHEKYSQVPQLEVPGPAKEQETVFQS